MRIFDTKEEAEVDLVIRKIEALKHIEQRGDKVLSDSSFVEMTFADQTKWTSYLMIYTEQMLEDLKKIY